MDDSELITVLEVLSEEELEIIYPVVEELAEERNNVKKFIR